MTTDQGGTITITASDLDLRTSVWEPTMNLRWDKRAVAAGEWRNDVWVSVGYEDIRILQQEWIERSTGERTWRDIEESGE